MKFLHDLAHYSTFCTQGIIKDGDDLFRNPTPKSRSY